ncbi:MAG: hypothetical protein ACN6NJ_09015 [Acinetobacter sp.]
MDRTIRLGIIMGLIVIVLLTGLVYILRPAPMNAAESPQPIVVHPTNNQTVETSTVPLKAEQTQPLQPPVSQMELLQQRDRLYQDFEHISEALSQGQQPDLRQINALLDQQSKLVRAGVLSAEEAISYSQFLKQILPALDNQINSHIQQLEQLKLKTSST